MQKILFFEITTAVKDRPKVFQIITLALFALSVTIILMSVLSRFNVTDNRQVNTTDNDSRLSHFATTTSQPLARIKK